MSLRTLVEKPFGQPLSKWKDFLIKGYDRKTSSPKLIWKWKDVLVTIVAKVSRSDLSINIFPNEGFYQKSIQAKALLKMDIFPWGFFLKASSGQNLSKANEFLITNSDRKAVRPTLFLKMNRFPWGLHLKKSSDQRLSTSTYFSIKVSDGKRLQDRAILNMGRCPWGLLLKKLQTRAHQNQQISYYKTLIETHPGHSAFVNR